MFLKKKSTTRIAPSGNKKAIYSGALPGVNADDLVTVNQVPIINSSGNIAQVLAFTGANTHTGAETHTGIETHAGVEVFSAGATFGAPNTYKGVTTITAFATGGQGSATALTGEYNQITVCATAGDSVILATPVLGSTQSVTNLGATAADVFPVSGGTIDGLSANTAVRIQPGQTMLFKGLSSTAVQSNNPASGVASQGTNITTTVVLNTVKGVITTQAASAGASGATPNQFTLTNSFIVSTSNIAVYVCTFAGTGNPAVSVVSKSAGACVIQLSSFSAAALNGIHQIGFEIKN